MTSVPSQARHHMDQIYRVQRHFYDLTRKYYLLGRDKLLRELDVPKGGTVLEVACGTGRNLIHTARKYPDAQFYGFDISEEMLITARQSIKRAGMEEQIRLSAGDATNFDGETLFGHQQFDRVVISYALSMIPPWQQSLAQAYASVAPGGTLHIVDFGQQIDLPRWFKSLLFTWLTKFSVTPRAKMLLELEMLAGEQGADLHFESLYRGYAYYGIIRKPA